MSELAARATASSWVMFCGGTGMHSFVEALLTSKHNHIQERHGVASGCDVDNEDDVNSSHSSSCSAFPSQLIFVFPVTDDGGSSRALMDSIGGPPVGDVRNMAVSVATAIWRYRLNTTTDGNINVPPERENVHQRSRQRADDENECDGFVRFLQGVLRHRLSVESTSKEAKNELLHIVDSLLLRRQEEDADEDEEDIETHCTNQKERNDIDEKVSRGGEVTGTGTSDHRRHHRARVDDEPSSISPLLRRCKRRAADLLSFFITFESRMSEKVATCQRHSPQPNPSLPMNCNVPSPTTSAGGGGVPFDWRGASVGNLILTALLLQQIEEEQRNNIIVNSSQSPPPPVAKKRRRSKEGGPLTRACYLFWRHVCGIHDSEETNNNEMCDANGDSFDDNDDGYGCRHHSLFSVRFVPCMDLVLTSKSTPCATSSSSSSSDMHDEKGTGSGASAHQEEEEEEEEEEEVEEGGGRAAGRRRQRSRGSDAAASHCSNDDGTIWIPLPRVVLHVKLQDGTTFYGQTGFSYGSCISSSCITSSSASMLPSSSSSSSVCASPPNVAPSGSPVRKDYSKWCPLSSPPDSITFHIARHCSCWSYEANESFLDELITTKAERRRHFEGRQRKRVPVTVIYCRGSFVTSMVASAYPLRHWLARIQETKEEEEKDTNPVALSDSSVIVYCDRFVLMLNGSVDRETSAFHDIGTSTNTTLLPAALLYVMAFQRLLMGGERQKNDDGEDESCQVAASKRQGLALPRIDDVLVVAGSIFDVEWSKVMTMLDSSGPQFTCIGNADVEESPSSSSSSCSSVRRYDDSSVVCFLTRCAR